MARRSVPSSEKRLRSVSWSSMKPPGLRALQGGLVDTVENVKRWIEGRREGWDMRMSFQNRGLNGESVK